MASVLAIAGSTVNRFSGRILVNRLTHSLDSPDCLEFTELSAAPPGAYAPEQAVTLNVDGTLEFSGWIFSRHFGSLGTGCPWVGYRCLDLRYGASLIPVTASDGTGVMRFNLPTQDDFYQSTQAGKSVGDILTQVFNQHSTQLTAKGIATDATTTANLAALTVVPPEPVYILGNDVWSSCLQLITQWYASKYALWITPGGKIRVTNTTTLSAATLTLDTDPILLDSLSEDTSECFTQVALRGAADVQPYYASLLETTLVDPNTGANETAWNIYKFLYPPNAFSTGTISAQTSTTVTISSDSATETWGVNYWNGIQAQIAVINPAITGIADLTGAEWKTITSNTALGAGGSSTITVDSPFSNTGYTRYAIRGQPAGSSDVYRKYTFKNRYVAQHLVKKFQHSVPWSPSQGALQQTLFPQAVICSIPSLASSTVQWPLDFEVIPYDGTTDGYIRFYEPVVDVVGGNGGQVGQPLIAGGSAVTKPADIIVVVPYSRGALSAVQPLSGGTPTYSGTAYTRFGIQRTLNRDYPDWLDRGNLPAMQTLANEILATVSNVVQEGSITYLGKYGTALVGGSWPFAVNIAKAGGTTTFESMAAPVRTAVLEWPQEGAVPWITRLQFSTRRQQYSGDRLYMHPMYNYQGGIFGGVTEVMAVGAPLAGFEAAGLPGAMGGYGGETGRAPLPGGQLFRPGAMGGPLGFSPVNAAGMGGANLPGFGTARTGLMPDLSQLGDDFTTALTPNIAMQEAQQRQAEQREDLMGRVATASQSQLPAGFAGYEVAGTVAPPAFNPYPSYRMDTQALFGGMAGRGGLAGPGLTAAQAQRAMEGGVTARGPTAAQARGLTARQAQFLMERGRLPDWTDVD